MTDPELRHVTFGFLRAVLDSKLQSATVYDTLDFVGTVQPLCGIALADVQLPVSNLLGITETTSAAPRVSANRKAKLEALKLESDLALRDQIRRLLALPPDRRTHFLRKRVIAFTA